MLYDVLILIICVACVYIISKFIIFVYDTNANRAEGNKWGEGQKEHGRRKGYRQKW